MSPREAYLAGWRDGMEQARMIALARQPRTPREADLFAERARAIRNWPAPVHVPEGIERDERPQWIASPHEEHAHLFHPEQNWSPCGKALPPLLEHIGVATPARPTNACPTCARVGTESETKEKAE